MNRLGSVFLDDFVKERKPVFFQLTGRGVLLIIGVVVTLSVTTLLFFFGYPDLLVVAVTLLLFFPTIVFGLSIDKKLSLMERFSFFLLIKRRVYQTEDFDEKSSRKEYHSRDFIQAKTVRETDPV
ncbi:MULTISPECIES: hypothetical protein [unclassified Streptococcus]|uniref:hypothetical protein n=1 Tax=unclassified Streptococcus TaxID=2608887 RepID=UPI001071D7C2|nr:MULTISPECIES: hypothetical protein [unclassified Streptococcus]MBF0787158.1 hypothetical protein [Streptococcus sp. 19428wC2_LYSM12]MCQ9212126.1 hypothetical protein [Streptococcus sp. B01]MCQ9213455.1 hypothetical protein [Streptococcus sp. O1]TFV05911.1 hypothetical protein E4T79_04510 [Streptococcus sp. LYSM12]